MQTATGEWWGFSMMDFNSVGRLPGLSPVTWKDGWPYFGLPGNLTRTPRTWVKPNTGQSRGRLRPTSATTSSPGRRSRTSGSGTTSPDASWSLSERPGFLRLHSLPAPDFLPRAQHAHPALDRPRSQPTAALDVSGMKPGDVAGLALLNLPYAWIGRPARGRRPRRSSSSTRLTGQTQQVPFRGPRVWLRARCDFLTETARFSYSTDGETFTTLGGDFTLVFQLKTFQGVRYALFHYNDRGAPGGSADFDRFTVREPHPRGLMRPIPLGQTVSMSVFGGGPALAVGGETRFQVLDRGTGRVALRGVAGFLSVSSSDGAGTVALRAGEPGEGETFQWTENVYGDVMLLSLATHR